MFRTVISQYYNWRRYILYFHPTPGSVAQVPLAPIHCVLPAISWKQPCCSSTIGANTFCTSNQILEAVMLLKYHWRQYILHLQQNSGSSHVAHVPLAPIHFVPPTKFWKQSCCSCTIRANTFCTSKNWKQSCCSSTIP